MAGTQDVTETDGAVGGDPEPYEVPANAHRVTLALAVLLTLGTGAMDAIGFARLGDVFTSVMTGNLVLLGVSAGRGDADLAINIATALVAFALAVIVAGHIAPRGARPGEIWPRGVTYTLIVQLVVMIGFVVGWQLTGAEPDGWQQSALLVTACVAMGLQSGAVVAIGVAGLSTTYVTGMLTGVLTTIASARRLRWDSAAILSALVVGATITGLLIVHAPRYAVVLPMAVVVIVVAVALRSEAISQRRPRR
jgi:uncharacterized membrane protein YoaK (UPF0700 family)